MDINDPTNANNPVLTLMITVIIEKGVGKMDTLLKCSFKFCKLVNSVSGISCSIFLI